MSYSASLPPQREHFDVHCEEDLLVARIRGPYDEAVAQHIEFHCTNLVNRYGYRLVLFHAREATTITPGTRQRIVAWNRGRREPFAVAIVGASFTAKTLATLMYRARQLLTKAIPVHCFFDSEAEARAWLDKERSRFQAQLRAKTQSNGLP